jgi:hypothetical protein
MAEKKTSSASVQAKPFGMLAEYTDPTALAHAAEKVRDAGYKKFDVYSPFPIHGMDEAMGIAPSKLGWIVIAHSLLGFLGGVFMIVWMMGVDYPNNISGKPFLNFPAFVPVTYELTILLSAFGAVFGMFFLNNLPRHNHPLFSSDKFKRATDDSFFLVVEADDAQYQREKVQKLLKEAGAVHLEEVLDK